MKKIMFCLAIAGMFAFAACNNNKPAEECADTTACTEQVVEEAPATDSTAVEAPAEDAAAETTTEQAQ